MKIEIWSDVVCPWCYVGKHHLDRALADFAHADEVEIAWKAFELDPAAPAVRPGTQVERLASKYGISVSEARARMARMVSVGAAAGIEFRFDDERPGNTFDAHRLLHLAAEAGVQSEMKERLFRATFTEGHPIGDRDTLVKLAADAGVDDARAREALDDRAFADAVRADEDEARALGIRGVPFFVFDRRYAVSGAQPPHALLQVLEQTWGDAHPVEVVSDDPAGCEGDACDL
jgi:predicted DsbA family dithiol-disulfide isomerase